MDKFLRGLNFEVWRSTQCLITEKFSYYNIESEGQTWLASLAKMLHSFQTVWEDDANFSSFQR